MNCAGIADKICVPKSNAMKKIFFLLLIICSKQFLYAQGVKIGGAGNPDSTALLELDGTSGKGLLLPRLTAVQMNALAATDGMLIYNATDASLYIRKNNAWQKIAEGSSTGGFSLPHTSSHNASGQYLLDLTNTGSGPGTGTIKGVSTGTGNGVVGYSDAGSGLVGNSNTGSGGYFSSSAGSAIVTGSGNVGIGTVNPDKARLQVTGTVGAVSALFENGPGIAIENNHPGIGFNTYYNQGRKNIAAGYGGAISLNPANGDLGILTSAATANADAINPVYTRLMINKDGNIGLGGNVAPHAPLSFSDALGSKIAFWGNNAASHYGIGIQPNLMQIHAATQNDHMAFGYGGSTAFTELMRIKGNGNVGIGTTNPAHKLHIVSDGTGIVHSGNGVEVGTSTSAIGGMIRTFTNHALRFGAGTSGVTQMMLTQTGEVGIGTAMPYAKLHVSYNNPAALQLDNSNVLSAGVKVQARFKTGSYYTGLIGTTGNAANSSRLSFHTGTALSADALTEKMSILDNGNVGINTTTPTARLEVNGKTVLEQGNDNAALEVKGLIRFTGNNSPLFTVTAGASTKAIVIDHPLCNNDPGAYLMVTPRSNAIPFYVQYDNNSGKWRILTDGYHVTGYSLVGLQRCDVNLCLTAKLPGIEENSFFSYTSFSVLVVKK